MMDAKTYVRRKFANDYESGSSTGTCLDNLFEDCRLKIELLPPPPRFEVHRSIFGSTWNVVDVKLDKLAVIASFADQARAMDYAKWQNSLEEQ